MRPQLRSTEKGKITVDDKSITFDFYINSRGSVVHRYKAYSTNEPDSLHVLSLDEVGSIYDPRVNEMIIGYGLNDKIKLTNEATDFLEEKKCKVKLLPLDEAIIYWNRYEGKAVGLFHIT